MTPKPKTDPVTIVLDHETVQEIRRSGKFRLSNGNGTTVDLENARLSLKTTLSIAGLLITHLIAFVSAIGQFNGRLRALEADQIGGQEIALIQETLATKNPNMRALTFSEIRTIQEAVKQYRRQ